jgi:mono/diheme cytochrome c family protein
MPRAKFSISRPVQLLLLSLAFASSAAAQARPPAAKKAAPPQSSASASGFYTAAQATRGDKVFAANCVACHARRDMGSADFQLKWNGRTVHDLFERVQSTMPESDPGSLSATEYADVVAYLLKLNGMPAGKTVVAPGPALKKQKLAMTAAR